MIEFSFQKEFEEFKNFYVCAKCHTHDLNIPILLKPCHHIFCTKCLIIRGKQHCPKCNIVYNVTDIDRGNKFVLSILEIIRNLEQIFPTDLEQDSNKRFVLHFDAFLPEQMQNLLCKLSELVESVDNENDSIPSRNSNFDVDPEYTVNTEALKTNEQPLKIGHTHKKAKLSRTSESVSVHLADTSKQNPTSELDIASESFNIESEFQNVKLSKEQLKRNPKGETLLHLACKRKDINVIQELIDSGVDINCVDWANWTPLHEAVLSKSIHSVKLLLEAGCLVNVPAANYSTPLHQAVALQYPPLIKLLIQYGANQNAIDATGKTPSDLLDISKHINVNPVIKHKSLVFNCDSSKCSPKPIRFSALQLLQKFTVTDGMEHLIVDSIEEEKLYRPDVMAALLKAVPIIPTMYVPTFLECSNLSFFQFIPNILQTAFKRSLHNRLYQLPLLFDGMNIHLPPQLCSYKIKGAIFTSNELQGLIEIAGGCILKRPPSESTVQGSYTYPFHNQSVNALRYCAHFIIYDDNSPPILLYNMRELLHVSARWIIECIWNFKITWD